MNSELVRSLQHQGKIVDFYLNDTFYPLNTVITIIHNGKDFIYSGGVAGSFNIYKAVLSSLEEAYLLMWQNYFHEKISSNNYFSRPLIARITTLHSDILKMYKGKKKFLQEKL
ncbi:hypothetical protein GTID1_18150 (plasmid) [Geobacillus thermodenitrificans]|nr:hypothetical protein GTID1_18150 [Geobacillus thermodenitrificans]